MWRWGAAVVVEWVRHSLLSVHWSGRLGQYYTSSFYTCTWYMVTVTRCRGPPSRTSGPSVPKELQSSLPQIPRKGLSTFSQLVSCRLSTLLDRTVAYCCLCVLEVRVDGRFNAYRLLCLRLPVVSRWSMLVLLSSMDFAGMKSTTFFLVYLETFDLFSSLLLNQPLCTPYVGQWLWLPRIAGVRFRRRCRRSNIVHVNYSDMLVTGSI